MAELILTEDEINAGTYLEWDDETLGRAVKALALELRDTYGQDALWFTMAGHVLIDSARQINAETTGLTLSGVTVKGEPIGDWRIVVERIKAPE